MRRERVIVQAWPYAFAPTKRSILTRETTPQDTQVSLERNSFVYLRYQTAARGIQTDAAGVRATFAELATTTNGALFGCWRSLVGLGLGRDEGLALLSFDSIAAAAAAREAARAMATQKLEVTQAQHLEATVRPTSDSPPEYPGVYVFRWFEVNNADWADFRDLSDAAWPNMESVFDVNICGFWRSQEQRDDTHVLLLTRYADLSVWEASRWWNNPTSAANESMRRFKNRNELIKRTVAYPTMSVLASTIGT